MKLKLKKPLIIFDLETTGLDLVKDRIIQISFIKITPDGQEYRTNLYVNPERSISAEAIEITGITDEQLKDAPTFKQIAPQIAQEFEGCDFAGFNSNNFDIPMLAEEFLRAGIDIDFSNSQLIDAHSIFIKMEPRNLAAAYKFYCGRKMEDDFVAHKADQDTEATYRILQGQLDMYSADNQTEEERQIPNDMEALAKLSKVNNNVDFAGRIVWKELKDDKGNTIVDEDGNPKKQEVFAFGKYKGVPVAEALRKDSGYYGWIINGDFPQHTKQVLTRIRLRELKRNL